MMVAVNNTTPSKALDYFKRLKEMQILSGMLVFIVLVWGFAIIAHLVFSGQSESFDTSVMMAMRVQGNISQPVGPEWLEGVARDFTALGGNAILASFTLLVLIYALIIKKPHVALVIILSALGALLLSLLMKAGFNRPRPELISHGATVYTASFPSQHAMLSASIYLTLGTLLARLQKRRLLKVYVMLAACLFTFVVGVSRVYLGVHWPTDVFAGWIAGILWAMICWFIAKKIDVL